MCHELSFSEKFPGVDISYAVSRDSVLINWMAFFDKKTITDLEWVAARDLSVKYQTTAVADVSVYLPRYRKSSTKGCPQSGELQKLNKKFSQAIWMKDIKTAKQLYLHIMKRGLELTMGYLNGDYKYSCI